VNNKLGSICGRSACGIIQGKTPVFIGRKKENHVSSKLGYPVSGPKF
jgi:hypothetical protein